MEGWVWKGGLLWGEGHRRKCRGRGVGSGVNGLGGAPQKEPKRRGAQERVRPQRVRPREG